jgi:hypothetical protein
LNAHRCQLTVDASDLYDDVDPIGSSGLLATSTWIVSKPIDLDQVELM